MGSRAVFGDGIVGGWCGTWWLVLRVAPISESRNDEPFKLEKAKNVPVGPQNHEFRRS